MILTQCVRCWTRYCDASCQLEHWSKGHKKQCKKIARGGGAEQFHAEAKYREAADAAVAESAPRIPADAICYICREDASRVGLVSGCGCHGGAGIAHMSCLIRQALAAVKEFEETGCGEGSRNWQMCYVCRDSFRGPVQLALSWASWKASLSEPVEKRWMALGILGAALCHDTEHAEAAVQMLEATIATLRRNYPNNSAAVECILSSQGNLAHAYTRLERHQEALRLYRAVHAGNLSLRGPAHEETIQDVNNVSDSLVSNRRFAEAKKLARANLKVGRRALGERHQESMMAATRLAEALYLNPDASRADILEAEALLKQVSKMTRNVLGPYHPDTICASEELAECREALAELEP